MRLTLILLAWVSMLFAFPICWGFSGGNVDSFDIIRHNGYYLSMGLVAFMSAYDPGKFERLVIFLRESFIYGLLVNCFIYNLEQLTKPVSEQKPYYLDRDFHWYSLCFVLMGVFTAFVKVYPAKYNQGIIWIFGINKFSTWLCRTAK